VATVFVSAFLRPLIRAERLQVPGATVGAIISRMETLYPGIADLLVEDGDIKAGIAVAINDQVGQMGLFDEVAEDAELHFLPALSGGAAGVLSLR
jgi:molybdopterin converting factor small subunit